jgi:two-component system, OmpR family, sensor histidine kinase AdeS
LISGRSIQSVLARRIGIFTVSVFLAAYVAVRVLDVVTYNIVMETAPKQYLDYREKLLKGESIGRVAIEEVKYIGEKYDDILWNWQYFELFCVCLAALLVVSWLASSTAKLASAPIAEIAKGADDIAKGAVSARVVIKDGAPSEISSLIASFNSMAASLEHLENERILTAAAVAHELATPLMILRGRLQGMVDDVYEPNKINIGLLIIQVDALGRLVEDLRTLSLYNAGKITLKYEEIYLRDIISEVIQYFDGRECEMKIVGRGDVGMVSVDVFRFRQLLIALVENATKYAVGGKTVVISSELLVNTEGRPGVMVSVLDDGPGFQEADVGRVFDAFWRGSNSADGKRRGTGLGLSVVRAIAEAHGGQATASNNPAGGALVEIWIPADSSKNG